MAKRHTFVSALLIALWICAGSGFFLPVKAASPAGPLPPTQGIFYDADGLIVHHRPNGEPDGGDTAQREGWYWLGVWIRENTPGLQPWLPPRKLTFDQVLRLLEPNQDGVFYRHPKLLPWNDPHAKDYGFSRDQMEPLVAAMGVWGKDAELKRLWNALPEDLLGKHTFNGNWRNFLGQDGADCSAIKKRGCDASGDCSLKVDNRDCSLKTDNRDCSLEVDTRDCSLHTDNRDCSLHEDQRNCGHDITICLPWPFNNQCHTEHINDPICEAAKAAQNLAYKGEHDACEAAKAAQNGAYKGEHDACEAAKGAQNGIYKAKHDQCEAEKAGQNVAYKVEHDACEAGKASQNVIYKAEHDGCELAKTTSKAACETQKAIDSILCMITNVHSGDIVGPMTVNLFRRALGEDPMIPISLSIALPPVNVGGGPLGEAELGVNVGLRLAAATRDKDDTGDDLNLIVKLLMAQRRFPTGVSEGAVKLYATRPHTYGSYLGTYRQVYGTDVTDIKNRIAKGIDSGWQPDTSAIIGAMRWYHRADTGANPQLAELYESIVDLLLK